ncbi:energy-coupling factor transporter transmembrane component T family protein [Limnochorda pilosa]|uniref:Cobalt transporter n=1 Tax=Limnochorda pilosa TaxID=1555112 RepID=A0A0K2SKF9_LIMPI|nr:energy-coupling factor transporter transmembrane component T [Limnochorda pilosa]BAS27324.1 cobalt transporter [Limnochorda pilosa]
MRGWLQYLPVPSPVHRLHSLTKLAWAVAVFVVAVALRPVWALALLYLSVLAVAAAARLLGPNRAYYVSLGVFGGVILLGQILFDHPGSTLVALAPTHWPILGPALRITDVSLVRGLQMALRMLAVTGVFPVLLGATQPRDLVMALVERLRVPYDYAFLFVTTLRWMPMLVDEFDQVQQAQRSRAYRPAGRGPLAKARAYAPLAVPLVLLSMRHAQRLAVAMETRGYGAGERTYWRPAVMGTADRVLLALLALVGGVAVAGAFGVLR